MPAVQWGGRRWNTLLKSLPAAYPGKNIALFKTMEGVLGSTLYSLLPDEKKLLILMLCGINLEVGKAVHLMAQSRKKIISPWSKPVLVYVVCPLVYPEKGPRGRPVCLCVVCPLVYPEKGPRGRLVCFCAICLLLYREKGPRGSLVCV